MDSSGTFIGNIRKLCPNGLAKLLIKCNLKLLTADAQELNKKATPIAM